MASAGDADFAVTLAKQGLRIEERVGRGRCLVAERTFRLGEIILTQVASAVSSSFQAPLDPTAT